ncbi:Ger(x)C family spore germination C-terminal domain-containing protein [Neobacillus sp. NRS-1170]|uniref:Ger(x)C family spore germination protein n=1 Tax=Neobacillus sp. NRS-1170 TaxID=3233898 RepID=UPI003D2A1C47
MLKVRKRIFFTVLILCVVIVSGCVEPKQLEKLGLVTAVGYDLEKKNVIRGTIVVHQFDPVAQNITKMITTTANTSKGLRQGQNLQSNQKLVTGQMRCVIYSKELAEKGVIQLVDALNRDSTVGNMVYLTIADGSAKDILDVDKTNSKISLGTYLYNLIKQNVESEQILSPTLQEFNHNYYDIGKDPVLPVLKVQNRDVIIKALALFKDDRYVAELGPKKHFYLKILSDKYNAGTHELGFKRSDFEKIRMKKGEHSIRDVYSKLFIDIDNINSHAKLKLIDKKNLKFKLEVKLDSRLLESTEALDYSNPASVKFIEKKLNQVMEKDIKGLMKYFQKLGVDPVGIGNEYKAHLRGKNLTKKEWREIYKRANFEVHVKNRIVKTGVID